MLLIELTHVAEGLDLVLLLADGMEKSNED
jgi:hypothetical protein